MTNVPAEVPMRQSSIDEIGMSILSLAKLNVGERQTKRLRVPGSAS